MSSYGERLAAVTAARGRLCVGIDPHRSVIEAWGYEYGLAGLEAVARGMVEALGDVVAVFKPQSAFFVRAHVVLPSESALMPATRPVPE